jgi:uncharacterized membrane protein YccC
MDIALCTRPDSAIIFAERGFLYIVKITMSDEKRQTVIYMAKVIAGVLLCYVLSLFISKIDYAWSLISLVLVLSPELTEAKALAEIRIKGNIVGCLVGVLFLFAGLENPVNIMGGAVVALFLCLKLKIMPGARSTLAALVITLMHTESGDFWGAALTRVAAVVAGCAIALAITYFFHNWLKIETGVASKTAA